jgi:hypothetical protein
MIWTCSIDRRDKKCMQNFGGGNILKSLLLEGQKRDTRIALRLISRKYVRGIELT